MAQKLLEPLTDKSVHLCVDMQTIFSSDGLWPTPWMSRVLPVVVAITARFPARTIFTRFVTPPTPQHAGGRWRKFYERWPQVTGAHIDQAQLDILPELARFAPPAVIVDRLVYSAFFGSRLLETLRERNAEALIISGAETDVCVLSTVMSAIDHGFRVVIVEDAICSSSDDGHDSLLSIYRNRFSQQVEICNAETILSQWAPDT
jgi:nicotinamidase-related amidase